MRGTIRKNSMLLGCQNNYCDHEKQELKDKIKELEERNKILEEKWLALDSQNDKYRKKNHRLICTVNTLKELKRL